jgi:D-arginine dehydrogenase
VGDADFVIIGGGIAGLSAGARLARHGRTVVLEAEDALGYHSSGRSATFSHYGIGNAPVRALTAHSRAFLEHPPEGFTEVPLARTAPRIVRRHGGHAFGARRARTPNGAIQPLPEPHRP